MTWKDAFKLGVMLAVGNIIVTILSNVLIKIVAALLQGGTSW